LAKRSKLSNILDVAVDLKKKGYRVFSDLNHSKKLKIDVYKYT